MKYNGNKKNRGFTLVETVIAMGIITIMITAFLAAFGPAAQGIRKSISAKEANRLASTLESELSILRVDEAAPTGDFSTAFEKAYEWIEGSGSNTKENMVLLYQYRGDPNSIRADGTPEPFTGTDGVAGVDYIVQTVVRRFDDTDELTAELAPRVVEGRVFFVRMTQLIFDNGELVLAGEDGAAGGAGRIVDPNAPDEDTNFENYPDAVIAFQAQFYALESSLYQYAAGPFDPNDPGKPVFTRNMAVRR